MESELLMQIKKKTKILNIILITLLCVIIILISGVYLLFRNEIKTANSIKRVNDEVPFFTMTYEGDYGLEEFLKVGASNDNELIEFITKRLLKGLPIKFSVPELGCSTFSAISPENEHIFGRNFDLNFSPSMLVKTAPDDGYRSMSMVNLAFLGYDEQNLPTSLKDSIRALAAPYVPLDGINEKGLAIGVLLIHTSPTNQQTDKVDITTTTAIRMILDKCATVDEAIELLKNYDMHSSGGSSYHFQIADNTGRSVVLEYINDEISIIESKMATNFLLTPGDWDFGKGQDRFEILKTTLEQKNGILTEEESMELLNAASKKFEDDNDSYTQWSAVYNQAKQTVNICINRDYKNVYSFSLNP